MVERTFFGMIISLHEQRNMKMILCLSIWLLGYIATLSGAQATVVEPEYLDQLIEEQRYEEFSELSHIHNPDLVRPNEEDKERSPEEAAMIDQGLMDDIVTPSLEMEEDRQGINFDKFPNSRWLDGIVYYEISKSYNRLQRRIILAAIRIFNKISECVKFKRRTQECHDYIFIFPGNRCWSFIGRTGGMQPLSLSAWGCLYNRAIIQEFLHAIGFAHEHNRCDRDSYIKILWKNIPEAWKHKYQKTNCSDFDNMGPYDFYSLMHLPINVWGTNKPAFQIKVKGVDERRVGNSPNVTRLDRDKADDLYC